MNRWLRASPRAATLSVLFVLFLTPACRHVGPIGSSGSAEPDERPADLGVESAAVTSMRGDLQRRLALLGATEATPSVTAQKKRIRAALQLLDRLDRTREGKGTPRDQERAAVRAYAGFVKVVIASEQFALPDGTAPDPGAEAPVGPPDLEVAITQHDEGDLEGALAEGYAVLDALQAVGIESLSLRFLLGTWALEAGDGILAEEQFEVILEAEGTEAVLVERAASGLSAARAILLGPDAAALADARDSFRDDRLADAERVLVDLLEGSPDDEVTRQAEDLRARVHHRAAELAEAKMARADTLMAGPGPYDLVAELLDAVRALPEGTWDTGEERRLRAWYRSVTRESDTGEPDVERVAADALMAEARGLVAAEDYRGALRAFARLEGTHLQAAARLEAQRAADILVKAERERAAHLFVAARKMPAGDVRLEAMVAVRDILAGLLDEFPDSSYADKVSRNLAVVDEELAEAGYEGG